MGDAVFKLFAYLGIDTKDYDDGLDKSEEKGSKFGSGLKVAAGVAAGAIAATTAATVASAKAFVGGVSDVAKYGDSIDKMSQKMNMSAKSYQEWDFVMQHAGTSIETMKAGIKTLSNAAETGNKAFKELGISQKDIASMSGEQLFSETIKALQGVEDETKRTYLAGKLLGRGATELGALLNMSAEETEAMKKEVHDLGGVMSDEAVKNAARFQDSLQNMQVSLAGVKNNLLGDFLPSFSTAMDGLSLVFSGSDVDGGLEKISNGIETMSKGLVDKAPKFFAIGGTILKALLNSITTNLPVLLEAAVPIIMELVTGIITNLPAVITAAVSLIGSIVKGINENLPTILLAAQQVLLTLATALTDNAPTLIPTVVNLIMTIVTTLTNPEVLIPLINAGINVIMGLIQGIISAIPLIVEQLPVIIDNIVQTLLQGLPLVMEAGISIFNALIDALPVIIDALTKALPQIIDLIVQLIIKGMPMLLQGAIQLFMAIIKALPTIITALVKNIPTIVTTIISTLLKNLPALIKGAVELFMGIVKAIPQIVIELGKQMPTIIKAIVDGLKKGVSQIASVGSELIKGLWNGISNMSKWIADKIKGFGKGVVDGLKKFFKISSPSKLFRDEIGQYLAMGLGEGFEIAMPKTVAGMVDTAEGAAEQIASAMTIGDMEISTNTSKTSSFASGDVSTGKTGNSIYLGPFTFNITASEGQDIRELAKEVSREIQNLIDDKEKAYA